VDKAYKTKYDYYIDLIASIPLF